MVRGEEAKKKKKMKKKKTAKKKKKKKPGVYFLEVLKDGEVLDKIYLDKRRQIFGRQLQTCDFVLDHQSVSRQHAAVVPHKDGSIYVIDLGSGHGTFVANERLTRDSPVELEVGQSVKFAASTRTYILRKNNAALFRQPHWPQRLIYLHLQILLTKKLFWHTIPL
ncbi:hypothetical protein MLD38_036704 [Melastoma candidum]|uniref:Uncharacterized protein n=1 Tax=Melastoma candidum TaxID=119954 RepID=A0ACB9LKR5_9MYRT|nr:hypothetical protein MLD38_036704 [Melastoma candidum]